MRPENVNNMPESSRETETEETTTTAKVKGNHSLHNIVSSVSQFLDENILLLRSVSTCLALTGVIVIARSIKLLTKFKAAHQIPARFIEKNVSLRGKVHSVTEKGLEVEHVPIYFPLLSPILSKFSDVSSSTILVQLAGVQLTPEGNTWLQNNLEPAHVVWLKLISRENDTLLCLVSSSKRSTWGLSVNEEVLMLGLARTAPIPGVLPDSRSYWRLHSRLHRAELKAERKGRGFWKEESLWERTIKAVSDNPVFRWIKKFLMKK